MVNIDYNKKPLEAIRDVGGMEERATLVEGDGDFAECTWKDGTKWQSRVANLMLSVPRAPVRVGSKFAKKPEKKKKPAAPPVAAEPVLAAAPVKKRPAAARVKKRPAAAPVAAPAAAPADAPAVAPVPAPADAPVPAPVVVAVPAVADADAPDNDYGIMYYKNNSIGVRAKYGLKNQLFCFGGQHCGKTKEQLRAIAVVIVSDLHRGFSVADAKARGNVLAFA